jgi:hypothetical protein
MLDIPYGIPFWPPRGGHGRNELSPRLNIMGTQMRVIY